MFLTPEEKDVGKENFKAAIGSSLIRRGFLQKGIREGIRSGNGLGPYYFKYGKSVVSALDVCIVSGCCRRDTCPGAAIEFPARVAGVEQSEPPVRRTFRGLADQRCASVPVDRGHLRGP